MQNFIRYFRFLCSILLLLLPAWQAGAATPVPQLLGHGSQIKPVAKAVFYTAPSASRTFEDLSAQAPLFTTIMPEGTEGKGANWMWFSLQVADSFDRDPVMAVPFADSVDVYLLNSQGKIVYHTLSGDQTPLEKRQIYNGQMVFMNLPARSPGLYQVYIRLVNQSPISQQFSRASIGSARIMAPDVYYARYEAPRVYQAFFYGALFIMVLYHLSLVFSLRSRSYGYYVLFMLGLIVFLASNDGYLLELLPAYPLTDLYLRFLSAPLLILSFLSFALRFLGVKQARPRLFMVWRVIQGVFVIIALAMVGGMWYYGRLLTIVFAGLSFLGMLGTSLAVSRQRYLPSRYFLAANLFLLLGGVLFALERVTGVADSAVSQYTVQAAVLIQVSLLSLGLAERIRLARQLLNEQKLENSRLLLAQEAETKALLEEKNRELVQKVAESTAEIRTQAEALARLNAEQENIIAQRTEALQATNQHLTEANEELAAFIYRTSHDIRGPLARLLGLCYVGKIDLEDPDALDYLSKIEFTAQSLDNILRRLTNLYTLTQQDIANERVDLQTLVGEVAGTLPEHHSELSLEIGEDTVLYSDRRMLRFVLYSLLENAVRYTRNDPTEIPQVWVAVSEKQDKLVITITDNGRGIPADKAGRLFSMFFRADEQQDGAGLGLYMARKVITRLGGSVAWVPQGGQLTQFQVIIPKGTVPSHEPFSITPTEVMQTT